MLSRSAPLLFPVLIATAGAPVLAISDYFPQTLSFVEPSWTVGTGGSTYQYWDELPATAGGWSAVTPTGSPLNGYQANPSDLPLPTLTVGGAYNSTPYIFFADTISATIYNHPRPAESTSTTQFNTLVQVQIAQTQGSAGDPFAPASVDYSIAPGSLKIVSDGVTYLPKASTLLSSVPAPNGFAFPDPNNPGNLFPIYSDQWLFTFELSGTADFVISWDTASHSVFEALRVDTLVQAPAVPEPMGMGMAGLTFAAMLMRRHRSHGGVSR